MSKLLTGDNLESYLTNAVHVPKQKHDFSFDLTVKSIFQPSPPAYIDFGGSEYKPAPIKEYEVEKKSPDDEYGWWSIPHGPKLVTFNEQFTIDKKTLIIVYPHEKLFQVGAFMVPFVVDSSDPKVFFLVGMPNLNIKQNAIIAKAIGWNLP
jgi:deoxycytidine triphosphate deaminase